MPHRFGYLCDVFIVRSLCSSVGGKELIRRLWMAATRTPEARPGDGTCQGSGGQHGWAGSEQRGDVVPLDKGVTALSARIRELIKEQDAHPLYESAVGFRKPANGWAMERFPAGVSDPA